MAPDGTIATETPGRSHPLQSAFSTAVASVAEACERLGLSEPRFASHADADDDLREDPHREEWASISHDVIGGAENAAFAVGLHHRAASELEQIERDLHAIKEA